MSASVEMSSLLSVAANQARPVPTTPFQNGILGYRLFSLSLSSARGLLPLQPIHPESVLCGRIGKDHVWIVQHVQPVQGQGVNFKFI